MSIIIRNWPHCYGCECTLQLAVMNKLKADGKGTVWSMSLDKDCCSTLELSDDLPSMVMKDSWISGITRLKKRWHLVWLEAHEDVTRRPSFFQFLPGELPLESLAPKWHRRLSWPLHYRQLFLWNSTNSKRNSILFVWTNYTWCWISNFTKRNGQNGTPTSYGWTEPFSGPIDFSLQQSWNSHIHLIKSDDIKSEHQLISIIHELTSIHER